MNLLAFDLGASSGKIFLGRFDGQKIQLEMLHRFEHGPCFLHNGLFWDIINICQQMEEGLRKAVSVTGDRISSFGIDSFSNDFAFIDPYGELLSQVHCYRDPRTVKSKEQFDRRLSPRELYSLSGNQLSSVNSLRQLFAMKTAGQEYFFENSNKLLFVPDFLVFTLTDQTVAEYTIASVSQMLSFRTKSWCKEILSAYDIPEELFGKLVMPGALVGQTTEDFNRRIGSSGFPVVSVCEHDTASAFLASVCTGDCAIISSGTWALVGTEVDGPIFSNFGFLHNVANEGGYPGHHRLMHNVGGNWVLQQIRTDCREKGRYINYQEMEHMAAGAGSSQYLLDLDDPIFFEPGNMSEKIRNACSRLYGDAPGDLPALLRCVYENTAIKYRWSVELLEREIGKKLPTVNILGGGSKDALMCQLTADISGKTVIAGPADATALGNMLVQLIADGAISSVEEGRNIVRASFQPREYLPREQKEWEEKYRSFQARFCPE